MKSLKALNQILTMSSREIAELTGKEPKNVLADIRKMLNELEINAANFVATFKAGKNNTYEYFNLPQDLADLLLQKYKGLARVPHRLQEEASLKTIEQLLNISLIRQYKVLNYRIDGYDAKNNIAYEIDEPEHRSKINQDSIRQKEIERVLKCKFVRIKL